MTSDQLPLFTGEVGDWPYPKPCPIRDECINHECYKATGGGCSGEHAICQRGQLAAGRVMPEWMLNLLSPYAQNYLNGVILGDKKALKALRRYEEAIERKYEDV